MESRVSVPTNQLLAYRFGSGSNFEGQLVGALERLESGGAMRVLDALFVGREAESGELVAVSLTADGRAGMIGRLLDFRLDAGTRASATRRALEGPAGEAIGAIGAELEPGTAFAAVLVEHTWALSLGEAIARIGGAEAANEFIEASRLSEAAVGLWPGNQD
jgi:hypothetical protein